MVKKQKAGGAGCSPRMILLTITMTALAVMAAAGGAFALNPQPLPPGIYHPFGMVGITATDTARLSAVYEPPDPCILSSATAKACVTPQPCKVVFTFYDQTGSVIIQSQPVTVAPGAAAFYDLSGDTSALASLFTGGRAEVRGAVTFYPSGPGLAVAPNLCLVEVFDTGTGKTSVILSPSPSFLVPALTTPPNVTIVP
jgi:hypothetical protein